MASTPPVPVDVSVPPGHDTAEAASAVVGPAVLLLWVAQLVLALVGVRARRRTADVAPSGPGTAAQPG